MRSCPCRPQAFLRLPGSPARLILSKESCQERRLCRCLTWLIGPSLHGIRVRTTLVLRDVSRVFNFAKSSVHYRSKQMIVHSLALCKPPAAPCGVEMHGQNRVRYVTVWRQDFLLLVSSKETSMFRKQKQWKLTSLVACAG